MSTCSQCGMNLGPSAAFCGSCGTTVVQAQALPASTYGTSAATIPRRGTSRRYPPPKGNFGEKRSGKRNNVLIVVFVAVVALAVFRFDVFGGESAPPATTVPATTSPAETVPTAPTATTADLTAKANGLSADPTVEAPADVEPSLGGVVDKAKAVTDATP